MGNCKINFVKESNFSGQLEQFTYLFLINYLISE